MQLLTKNIETLQAKLFKSNIEATDEISYVFAGGPTPWAAEASPPAVTHGVNLVEYNTFDTMVFGKRIAPADIKLMIRRVDWTFNTVYTRYDDLDVNLSKKDFYVLVESLGEYHIFICLDNNKGAKSLYAPAFEDTSPDDEFYFTADNYQWKYMFTVNSATYDKFSTALYVPFVENVNVTANTNPGSIETIVIDVVGSKYASYANGYFQAVAVNGNSTIFTLEATASANTDFYRGSALKIIEGPGAGQQKEILEYIIAGGQRRVVIDTPFETFPSLASKYEITPNVVITGDGINCKARAIINPAANTISVIEITNSGSNYSYATARVTGNTGILEEALIEQTSLRVILGPPSGFGGDVPKTLFVNTVGVSVNFANTELGTIPTDNKFRTLGIIHKPMFANVEVTVANTAGVFADGETVRVPTSNTVVGVVTFYDELSALLRLTNVEYPLVVNQQIHGVTSNTSAIVSDVNISGFDKSFNTFDQRLRLGITKTSVPDFVENDIVTQNSTLATGTIESANTTVLGLTNIRGVFNATDLINEYSLVGTNGATANVNSITYPDLKKNIGEIIYLENIQPVQRSQSTSETVKLNITFGTK